MAARSEQQPMYGNTPYEPIPQQPPVPQQPPFSVINVAPTDLNEYIIQTKATSVKRFGIVLIVLGAITAFIMIVNTSAVVAIELILGVVFGLVSLQAAKKRTLIWAKINFYMFAVFFILCVIGGLIFVILVATINCSDEHYYVGLCGSVKVLLILVIIFVFFGYPLACLLPCAVTGKAFMHAIARRDGVEPELIAITPIPEMGLPLNHQQQQQQQQQQ